MSLLERLETIYLAILRVVIIIGATGALVVAGFGLVSGLPLLVPDKPAAFKAESVKDADLAAYQESRAGGPTAETPAEPDQSLDEATVEEIDARLTEAAKNFSSYAQRVQGYASPPSVIEQFLRARRDSLPPLYTEAYSQSILELAKQTAASKDVAIDLDVLVNWHYQRFIDSAQLSAEKQAAKEAQRLAARTASLVAVGIGAAAFALFLLLVFCFLLVKIERNLRVVKTSPINPGPSAAP